MNHKVYDRTSSTSQVFWHPELWSSQLLFQKIQDLEEKVHFLNLLKLIPTYNIPRKQSSIHT